MPDNNNIELRSDEVQEILGTMPRWIVRRGITVILLIILVLLTGSYFYKYPDIIKARVIILSENPPVSVVSKANGKIDSIFVADKQLVKEGDILGIIENPADYNDAIRLISESDSTRIRLNTLEGINKITYKEEYSLGEYQSYYSAYVSQLKIFHTFLDFNPIVQKIKSLEGQIVDNNNYYKTLDDQAVVLKEDYNLTEHRFSKDSVLHIKGVLPDIDFEKSKAALLKQKLSYQSILTTMASVRITINQRSQEIRELEVTTSETEKKLLANLKESFDNLSNKLKEWEQTYVLKTPVNGIVTFNNIWAENQYITTGITVFSVVPQTVQKLIGKALVPVAGAGKTEVGQRVNIKLDNFPYIEYGLLVGKVEKISMVPVKINEGSYYSAEISLTSGLVTNYKKELPPNQEMSGVAEIITKDRRLIERLVQPLVSLFRERLSP